MSDFANLHVHTEYSLLDGFGSPELFAKRAAELGQPALAITDHGNLYGALEHAHACKDAGVKPILGCEVYVAPQSRVERDNSHRYDHLVLLAQNHVGWQNLMAIQADASLNGFYHKPRTDKAMLSAHADGLIVLSGCLGGEIAQALRQERHGDAHIAARWYKEVFGDRYYIEVQDHGQDDDAKVLPLLYTLADAMGVPTVATSDSHYPLREDAEHAAVLHCLQTGKTMKSPDRFQLTPYGEYYLPDRGDFRPSIRAESLDETVRIAERIDPDVLNFGRVAFPDLPWLVRDGETPEQALRRILNERWRTRFPDGMSADVIERVKYELGVVEKMGFSPYFLIVFDYVNWAREHGIVCQPRGSAGGSMVLYLLGISDLDPLRWDLPFERFLNPDRISMPDIDMDFPDSRRIEVLNYLIERYGKDNVAAIIAISRMKARAALHDVGRAKNFDPNMAADLVALVPTHPVDTTLELARLKVPALQDKLEFSAEAAELFATAQKLETTVRHASTHAAGAVVSAVPLRTVVPLQRPTKQGENEGGLPVCQWDMHWLEEAGLIKFDLLGLSQLTMVGRCLELVRERRNIAISLPEIPLDDPAAWTLLQEGKTKTLFQLESNGMTGWLTKLEPTSVEQVAAMVALYRPGPLAQIPSYIARRHHKEPVTFPHEKLVPILGPTYGIVVYQEQVMAISQVIGGFTPGEADVLRKVMGKKQKEKIAEQRAKFVTGAINSGHTLKWASDLFEWLEPFAGYGFNKSHAVYYGLLAYQTAYLKANYPTEWMAAVLEAEAGNLEKTSANLSECRAMGVQVLTPHVNRSDLGMTLEGPAIRLGLGAVTNVGAAAKAIITERTRYGPFVNLDDFATRMASGFINKNTVGSLAKAGAFDGLGAPRSQILANLEFALPAWRQISKARSSRSMLPMHVVLPESDGATKEQAMDWEREVLGFSAIGHPMDRWAGKLPISHQISELSLEGVSFWSKATIGGMIAEVQKIRTRRGQDMARIIVEDLTGRVNVIVFPTTYADCAPALTVGAIVLVNGAPADDEGSLIIKARTVRQLEAVLAEAQAAEEGWAA